MPKFKKAILRAGRTYLSPDGPVEVTPARLRHWVDQFKAMDREGLSVPCSWGHDDDPDKGIPIKFASRSERRRLPQDCVGYLHDMQLTPEGDAAEITLDIRGQEDADKARNNLAYVSPVIRTNWLDGDGTVWKDIFGHMDLVQHPVDHRQSEFVEVDEDAPEIVACALRMGLEDGNPKLYRLQGEEMAEDTDKKTEDTGEGSGEGSGEADAVENEGGRIKKVIEALGQMKIVLSDDTNEANFLEHLEQALLTAQAQTGEGDLETPAAEGDMEVATPELAMLSLERKKERKFIDNQHQAALTSRIDALCESGRCTPAEAKQKKPDASRARLSLDDNGKPVRQPIDDWIAARESVPKGTFWTDERRLRLSGVSVAPKPADMEELTEEQADAIADEVLGVK